MIKLPYYFIWQNPALKPAMYPFREKKLREFLLTYDEADLVKKYQDKTSVERKTLVLQELEPLKLSYEAMDQERLLEVIQDRFAADINHQRYPEWLRYVVIHFSGIRYKSAHGSWSNPALLIPKLETMVTDTLKKATPQQVTEMIDKARAGGATAIFDPAVLPADLQAQKDLLFKYLTAQELVKPGLTPEAAHLTVLERLYVMKDRMSFPKFFWRDVVNQTDLRLAVQTGDWLNDWENPPLADIQERQQTKDFRWATILVNWKIDSTAWRLEHYNSLNLVVTRVVCNELSEHIHHLRGFRAASGLTGKPSYYRGLTGKPVIPVKPVNPGLAKEKAETGKQKPAPPVQDLPDGVAYFGRPLNRTYFKPGASILSLGWVTVRPNAWQIAQPMAGVDYQEKTDPTWKYGLVLGEIVRTKPVPSPPGQPKKPKDEKAGPQAKVITPELKEWLRWTHEAIVVDVMDLLNGPNVITFETYPSIGINRTHISNKLNVWSEFLGYNPGKPLDPVKEALKINNYKTLLDRDRVLHAVIDEEAVHFGLRPGAKPQVLEVASTPAGGAREIEEIWATLTRREKQVTALICQGFTTRQVATRLDAHPNTIQKQLSSAMKKFHVQRRQDLKILLANWNFGEFEEDSTE
jgi:DNA-binding CsgD family transcriptional regulator